MKKIIITGHSNGLGKALTKYYLQQQYSVLGLSRSLINLELSEKLQQYTIDLSDAQAIEKLFSDGLINHFIADADNIILINNAGTVLPNAIVGSQRPSEIIQAISLNITAPLLLSNYLVSIKPKNTKLKIVHISSGAGRKFYPGWSVYGATKAALDQHAQCIAAEQHPKVQIASIAPGVVDTSMQAKIRSESKALFPMVGKFNDLKQNNLLSDPAEVSQKIANLIDAPNFGQQIIDDVRDH